MQTIFPDMSVALPIVTGATNAGKFRASGFAVYAVAAQIPARVGRSAGQAARQTDICSIAS